MPTTAAIIAGTGASLAGIGTVAWTAATTNIMADDDAYANAALGGSSVSRWCVATNFDLSSIPDDAVILGVTGTVAAFGVTNAPTITAASFVVGDAVVGTQKSLAVATTTTEAQYTIGGANDLWGYNITPAILKTSTTGWAVSMTGAAGLTGARINAMWLTVDYILTGTWIRRKKLKIAKMRAMEEDERYAIRR